MTELIAGITLGLAAGISPGPLQTLVVTSSLARGFGAGWRVSVAPLLTDVPIVALSVAVLSAVPENSLNGLAVGGGLLVIAVAVLMLRELRTVGVGQEDAGTASDVWRGALVNAISPHPWIFWIAVGGPLLVAGWRRSPANAVAFLAGFYVLLAGSKVVLAWVVARGRARLSETWRRRMIVGGAGLLALGGAVVLWQGAAGRFG